MCGLVGIFDLRGERPVDEPLLGRMNERQRHRGPDEGGVHVEPGVGLGHRRLSIIDLASGQQPLYNEDGSVVIVFNGEIYRYADTAAELARRGHRFRTRSDTEVIVHAWEEWGEACVDRLRGMFAFALWDRNRRTLFLARDRLGKKPLYYARIADGHLVFGSELKSLLVHPGLDRTVDPRAVEDYFAYGYVPDPKTIFAGVAKLPPGHSLTVVRGRPVPTPRRYWDVAFEPSLQVRESDAARELIDRFREATRIRMVAEVPLGAFLSGGVDSSAVVAAMAGVSADPVKTCTISFDDPAYDEARYAAEVARRYGTEHHVERVDPESFELLDTLTDVYDEPFADSSALPTYRVCQLARRHVTVALSGDGGDESLAGYRRYRWHTYEERVRRLLPAALRHGLFGLLGRLYPKLDRAPQVLRAKSTFESLARDSVDGYFHAVSTLGDPLRERLFAPGFRRELQGYRAAEVLREHAAAAPAKHPLSLAQYLDLKTWLPGDILVKVDRASMAHALEVRSPLLDHTLVEWLARLPPGLKVRGREGKYLFKKVLEPLLPHETLYRRKMGFSVPLARWFRGPLRERVRESLLGPVLGASGWFDRAFLEHLIDAHEAGVRDYSVPIWSLLMFEAFQRRLGLTG
jgi:asparagine synthase (glutamine-hydrolysing)